MQKQKVNIVWFKRDLRISDHHPLKAAAESNLPAILLCLFEPSLMDDHHYDTRHWRFVWQSLTGMRNKLKAAGHNLCIANMEAEPCIEELAGKFEIKTIYSHEETGIDRTYQRDKRVARWCKVAGIEWKEFPANGIHRGLMNRDGWRKKWNARMAEQLHEPDLDALQTIKPGICRGMAAEEKLSSEIRSENRRFQEGGEAKAWETLNSFLFDRSANYSSSISAPGPARSGCSRMSPYITWGNISIKQIVQHIKKNHGEVASKRGVRSFKSRLGWHCHFIQKFETEPRIEFENMNRGYDDIRLETDQKKLEAWEKGLTGFPMVDACMRSVVKTGYLNFRMRAMLVSFLTHHLWLDWRQGSPHLARQFLDFEPGIHYSQFQMQAGTMGVNTIRIYNPVKQGMDHDPDGEFIREWVPELRGVPAKLIHEPWTMSSMEQKMYECTIGVDYPAPVIDDIKKSYKHASKILWSKKGSAEVKRENKRIIKKHVKNRRQKS
jgi:deoxyribodipyrimidine photo-lyase